MMLYDLPAPAKLNLFLHVVGRRADGYHWLESLFRLISLSDAVTIDLRTDGVISREPCSAVTWSEADDLAVRAAKALQQATGTRTGAHIAIRKRIPTGGGLGGGSSDAATVLLGLNRLWRTGLTREELMVLGLPLGADVPFFLFGQSALVTGIGERFQPVTISERSYVVAQPNVSVPTPTIFAAADLTRDSEPVKISDFSGLNRVKTRFTGIGAFGRNDLEPVVKRLFPVVDTAQQWLASHGVLSRLTGSGACLFSEFTDPNEAVFANEQLLAKMQSSQCGLKTVHACDGLPVHPLQNWAVD
ncbi:MAG: 4-(cytidine 5'-diphospho)-2-C-methyl-D-erythritol kinase [Orrella sp.]